MDDKFRGYSSAGLLRQMVEDLDRGKDTTFDDALRVWKQERRDYLEGMLKPRNQTIIVDNPCAAPPLIFRPFEEGGRKESEIRIRVKRRKLKFNFNN